MQIKNVVVRWCQAMALILAIGAVVLAAAPARAVNLIQNPGFDDTASDPDSDPGDFWGAYGAAGFNEYFGAGNAHASFFADTPGNFGGVYQTGIAGSPGTEYQFDLLDVRIEANAAANFEFGLEFFLGDDSSKIGDLLQSIPLSVTGDGLSFSMTATAPAGTVFVRPIIKFDNVTSTADSQENVFVFNTSLSEVPEPASLSLLVIGGLLLRRRR